MNQRGSLNRSGGQKNLKKVGEEILETEETEVIEEVGVMRSSYDWFVGSIASNIVRPFCIGASGAFGMSIGYALFDFVSQRSERWFTVFRGINRIKSGQ